MPTPEDETFIALTKLDPNLPAWLLKNLFDVKVPNYDHARWHSTDVRVMVPRTSHADGKSMTTAGYEYQSEFMRNLAAKYRAEAAEEQAEHRAQAVASAVALAEARVILIVLEDRGVAVPDDVRDRVLGCTDRTQLGTWLHRASTATTIDQVIRE